MSNKVIGIVSKAILNTTDFYNEDIYPFVNNYGKRVAEAGGCPMGIIPVDGRLRYDVYGERQLEMCDCFLFSGGGRIMPCHMQVMEHAYRTGKKVLGICMGMQIIHTFFIVLDEAERRNYTDFSAEKLNELYDQMKKERYMFTEPVEHHWDINPTAEHMEEAKHIVDFAAGARTFDLVKEAFAEGENSLRVVTMHRYRVKDPSPKLTVTAFAKDGTIEGLEFGENIKGIQFHPEAETELMGLFRWLAE